MDQQILDFESARIARDEGIAQSFNHAADVDDSWPEAAQGFLYRYALAHEYFDAWEVTNEAQRLGYAPATTDRAWGAIFIKGCRKGWIEQWGSGRNPNRHNSICIRYRSCVFVGVPA